MLKTRKFLLTVSLIFAINPAFAITSDLEGVMNLTEDYQVNAGGMPVSGQVTINANGHSIENIGTKRGDLSTGLGL